MVAQQALCGRAQSHQAAQHAQGVWPTVDQVTQQEDCVTTCGEINLFQQGVERAIAALNIANTVHCHGVDFRL